MSRSSLAGAPVPPALVHHARCVALPAASSASASVALRRVAFHSAARFGSDAAPAQPIPAATPVAAVDEASTDAAAGDTSSGSSSVPPPPPRPVFLRMPPIDNMGKCRLLRWLVSVGEPFQRGAVLAEVDSDLAVIEYKAQADGMLALIRTAPGERIVGEQVLALQVERAEEIPNADRWNAHMKAIEMKDRAELEAHEAREEQQAKEEIEKEQQEQARAQEEHRAATSKPNSTR